MISTRLRSGYSLIELMVVISVSSTLMVISIGWIHQSMKLGSVMRDRGQHHQSLLRLSRQLRDDVHRGESLVVENENLIVITIREEQTVSYEIVPTGLTRHARDADQVTAQDSFPLDPRAPVRWESAEMPDWISLVVERGSGALTIPREKNLVTIPTASEPRPIDLHVRAALGRWARQTREPERQQ